MSKLQDGGDDPGRVGGEPRCDASNAALGGPARQDAHGPAGTPTAGATSDSPLRSTIGDRRLDRTRITSDETTKRQAAGSRPVGLAPARSPYVLPTRR